MQERPKGKSIGRKVAPKGVAPVPQKAAAKDVSAKKGRAVPAAKAAPAGKAAAAKTARHASVELSAPVRALLDSLASRTKLSAPEVVARALQSYAEAVAPELRSLAKIELDESREAGAERLFVSVDGRPEFEIGAEEFIFGSGPDCDLKLDLPLIAPKHARVLLREGRHVFEDLRSPKGSYRHGALVDVRFIEDGDEIDLGGFLPVRFRIVR